jgi:hypothetical protein
MLESFPLLPAAQCNPVDNGQGKNGDRVQIFTLFLETPKEMIDAIE